MGKGYCGMYETTAGKRLQQLAERPYDLTAPDALTAAGRLERYVCRAGSLRMLYSMQRVTDEVLAALQDLADECRLVEQFKEMRKGVVINRIEGWPSENRQVLHTACRDIFCQNPAEPAATAQAKSELEKLKNFLNDVETGQVCNVDGEKFRTLIHVGIGGSDLGPRAVYEALRAFGRKDRDIHFISNVDPDDAAAVLEKVVLKTALVVIVSKSGTTMETLANEKLVCQALRRNGIEPRHHCIAVTGKGSPMDDPDQYLRAFYMYDYIGGRYSLTSMVGLVTLGFSLGYEKIVEFLHGAAEMDLLAEEPDIRRNLPLLLALLGIWNHNYLGYPTVAVLPYSQALHRFPAHLQQCDMESNGKSIDRNGRKIAGKSGPVLWGEPGTNGQHAFYQLLHQGTEIVPVEFIGFIRSQRGEDLEVAGTSSQQKLFANLLAQSVALATGKEDRNPNKHFPGNRPSIVLIGGSLTPEVMGTLLALYEAKIVFQGFAWDINSFDQEGVQLGKALATRFLECMTGGQSQPESLELKLLEAACKTG
jgi:glucose-6-phosphate isomerase